MISRRKARKQWRKKIKQSPNKFCIIYGLYDQNGKLRYIGQTRQLLTERLRWFYKQVRDKRAKKHKLTRVEKWVEAQQLAEIPIDIRIIDDNATWDVSEIIYIERARVAKADLLNMVRGGNDTIHEIRREAK